MKPCHFSIIIPAYNEEAHIASVITRLKNVVDALNRPYEIIVVNDGSTDKTSEKARDSAVIVIDHEENKGYGGSLKSGILAAKGEWIILTDADGTYDISSIPRMISLTGKADLVVGNRIFSSSKTDRIKTLARNFFAYHTSYYAGQKIEDLNSGQRIFRREDIVKILDLFPDGFSFTSTMTVQYLLRKKTIIYTPVEYRHRAGSKFALKKNVFPIAKLAFKLTFLARPFKLSAQIFFTFAAAWLATGNMVHALNAPAAAGLLCFLFCVPFLFFLLLCYIYIMGKRTV